MFARTVLAILGLGSSRPCLLVSSGKRCTANKGNARTKSYPRGYDIVRGQAKPKQAIEAREIGGAEETEMKGSSVEDHRSIDLDVERRCDHDGATPEA